MNRLGELEVLVLFALLRLGEEAYGASIRREIKARAGRSLTPGTIYPTLDRLERKRLVRSRLGEPLAERGGRARRYFVLTPSGVAEVRRAWRQVKGLSEGLEGVLGGRQR